MRRPDLRLWILAASLGALWLPVLGQCAEGSRMTGRVIDAETLAPVANAEIELLNMNGGQGFFRARSDGKGVFTLDRIAPDRMYGLTVSAPGYADFVISGWSFPSPQRGVDVVVPLDRAGTIEVRALRADGKTPVANAKVSIRSERAERWWEGFNPPPAPVFTDKEGTARFPDLKAGSWTVTAETPNLLPSETRQVMVRRGETTKVPATLARGGSIAGAVRLQDGSVVPNVTVTARGPGEGVGTSGPDGEFAVEGLPPGRYRLEVSPEGFESWRSEVTYRISEGESRGSIGVVVTPKPPDLALVLEREAFVPGTPMSIDIRSFRADSVALTLYAIPPSQLLDPSRDFRDLAEGGALEGLNPGKRWSHFPSEGGPYTWRSDRVPLPDSLRVGAYLLAARASGLERRAIFFVTDLGLLVKRSIHHTLVAAATLKGGAPVEDAAVFVVPGEPATGFPAPFMRGKGRLGPGSLDWGGALRGALGPPAARTDSRGVAELSVRSAPERARIVAVSAEHGVSVAESPLAPAVKQGGDRVYLYTERPIYRPGQTVYWKLFARSGAESSYVLPTAVEAKVELTGPDGSSRAVRSAPLSRSGSSDGSFEIPADAPLGDWRVAGTVGAATGGASFGVQQYRKPEFRVEAAPDKDVYVNGDEVRFVVSAGYFFGAPVFGAAVRYTLFETRLGDFDEDSDEAPGVGFGRVIKTGEARTDVDGKLALAFEPPRASYDRRLTLEAEVVDAGNRVASGRGSVVVGRGLFTISVRPASGLVLAGRPIVIELLTRDHHGKPVSATVTVELDQDAWSPLEHRYARSTRPLSSASITTDASGRALLPLIPSPAKGGSLRIQARADDAKGNRITDESSVWVYDARFTDYAYRYPALEAFLDKERYTPGDTARVLINSDARNAMVLATVEGRDLYDVRTVVLPGNTALLEIPIRSEYAPNVFIALHVRRGNQVDSRTLKLSVEAPRRDLALRITPDRSEYRPGETAALGLEAHDASGRPAVAELSVGVVDEAIYSLRSDDTPEPKDFFYGERPNWVTTVVSFPILYYGGVDKGREAEVRKDFRDVALWTPTVWTDEQGRATVSVRWPDNLTTWRITSRGMTEGTLVGQTVAKTLVSKPIVARIAAPRSFIAGDQADLISVVSNRTRQPVLGVKQTFEAEGAARVSGETARTRDLPSGGESRESWSVQAAPHLDRDSAVAVLTFRSTGKTDADAVRLSPLVLPRAVVVPSRGAGIVEKQGEAVLTLPGDLIAPGSWVRIDVSPSPAAMALAGTTYLMNCPYAGTEPTANAIIAAAAVLEASHRAGVVPPGLEAPKVKLATLLDRLAALRAPQGGWGWWYESDPDPYLTSLAVDALARAEALGMGTPQSTDALAQGARAAAVLLAQVRSADGEAYVLAHLTPFLLLEGTPQQAPEIRSQAVDVLTTLVASRERLGVAALALTARSAAALGRMEDARKLVDLLRRQAKVSEGQMGWPSDPDLDLWFGEDLENTAYALSAILAVRSDDPAAASIVRWLAARRAGGYWRSTRVTAPVTVALADYLAAHASEMKPDYRLRAQWNGATILEREVTPADAFGAQGLSLRVSGNALHAGRNLFTLVLDGKGTAYYGWEAHALVPSPGPDTSPEKRLTVTREYFHAERTSDRRGRPRYLVTPVVAGEPFHVGEQVLVRLTLKASGPLRWVVVEDPRPSGFEGGGILPPGAEWPWGVHAEERDDRNAFFVDRLDEGDTVIESLLRPEISGVFTALPASASGFYETGLLTRTGEERLTVRGR